MFNLNHQLNLPHIIYEYISRFVTAGIRHYENVHGYPVKNIGPPYRYAINGVMTPNYNAMDLTVVSI